MVTDPYLLTRSKKGEGSCVEWELRVNNQGYGLAWNGVKCVLAHRLSYVRHKEEVIEGKVVMHTCDNKVCINPRHLKAGTQSDNIKDCVRKRRHVGNQQLSKRDYKTIFKLRDKGLTLAQIGVKMNCSFQHIGDILDGYKCRQRK